MPGTTSARKRGPTADRGGQSPVTEARERAGLTQTELADRLGVDRSSVHQTESRGDGVSVSTLRRYVEACGLRLVVSVED